MVGQGVSDTEMGHEEKGRWEWSVVSIVGMDRGEEAVTWSIWTQVTENWEGLVASYLVPNPTS